MFPQNVSVVRGPNNLCGIKNARGGKRCPLRTRCFQTAGNCAGVQVDSLAGLQFGDHFGPGTTDLDEVPAGLLSIMTVAQYCINPLKQDLGGEQQRIACWGWGEGNDGPRDTASQPETCAGRVGAICVSLFATRPGGNTLLRLTVMFNGCLWQGKLD
jgi:hypothetical protein